jgi:hypothetical protein
MARSGCWSGLSFSLVVAGSASRSAVLTLWLFGSALISVTSVETSNVGMGSIDLSGNWRGPFLSLVVGESASGVEALTLSFFVSYLFVFITIVSFVL